MQPLFGSSLRRDPLVWLWLVLVATSLLIALGMLVSTIEPGAHFDLGVLVGHVLAALSFLAAVSLFVLLLAGMRASWRSFWQWVDTSATGYVRRAGGGQHPPLRRDRPVPSPDPGPAATSWTQKRPTPRTTSPVAGDTSRPRLLKLDVSSLVTGPAVPVVLRWSFAPADSVTIDGVPGYPPVGSAPLYPTKTRPMQLVAHNGRHSTFAWTPPITVLPVPHIASLDIPPMPVVRMHADVRATTDATPLTSRVERVLASQAVRGPVPAPPLSPLGVPPSLLRWLDSVPRRIPSRTPRSR